MTIPALRAGIAAEQPPRAFGRRLAEIKADSGRPHAAADPRRSARKEKRMKQLLICDDCRVKEVAPLCRAIGAGIEVQAFYDP